MSTCSHENNPHTHCFITENSTWLILQGCQSTTWNYLKILQESQFLELGTVHLHRRWSMEFVNHFTWKQAFNILISTFCNTENSVKWLTSQSFRKLTAYPKTLQESQPLLELRTVHLHSRRINVHFRTWKRFTCSFFHTANNTWVTLLHSFKLWKINHLKLPQDATIKTVPVTRSKST